MSGRVAVLPQLGHGVRRVVTAVLVVCGEVGWWLAGGFRLLRRAPRRAATWLAGAGFAVWADLWWLLAGLLALVFGPGLWARIGPVSFERRVTHPSWRRRIARGVRRSWPQLMEACGLSRRVLDPTGATSTRVPGLQRVRWDEPDVLVTVPRLMVGQTVDDVVAVSERLRVAVGSRQIRIIPNDAHTGCTVRFLFADPLAQVTYAPLPAVGAVPNIDDAVMGVSEDGSPWVMPIRLSRLTAGCAGSGKAGVMHGTVLSLAPAVRSGLVQLHGIDLKGGMELGMSQAMFTRYATTLEHAVIILEDAVRAMLLRAEKLAGMVRTHVPTVAEPLVVVVIDELARMTAYAGDSKLMKRADAALRSLLALGRAPGYLVHAFVQDPRKDTVPQRHLFHESMALRLREREEVVMVLNEGAVSAGAACHKIPRSTPGIGYVLNESGDVTRVRVGHVTDDMIRAVAARFPAPRQIPVTVPEVDDDTSPRPRAPRKPRAPRGGTDHD